MLPESLFTSPVPAPWTLAAAAMLRTAGRWLDRAAAQLSAPARMEPARPAYAPPQIEFHAEAGAPEGALYADGVLLGTLPGITRL